MPKPTVQAPHMIAYLKWLDENRGLSPSEPLPPPVSPGLRLKEELTKRQLSQTAFAKMLGCTHAKVNEVIRGKRGISAEFALQLESVLEPPAEYWLSLESRFLLHNLRLAQSQN